MWEWVPSQMNPPVEQSLRYGTMDCLIFRLGMLLVEILINFLVGKYLGKVCRIGGVLVFGDGLSCGVEQYVNCF